MYIIISEARGLSIHTGGQTMEKSITNIHETTQLLCFLWMRRLISVSAVNIQQNIFSHGSAQLQRIDLLDLCLFS